MISYYLFFLSFTFLLENLRASQENLYSRHLRTLPHATPLFQIVSRTPVLKLQQSASFKSASHFKLNGLVNF